MQLADVSREDLQLDDTGGPLLLFLEGFCIGFGTAGFCSKSGRTCSWTTPVGHCLISSLFATASVSRSTLFGCRGGSQLDDTGGLMLGSAFCLPPLAGTWLGRARPRAA